MYYHNRITVFKRLKKMDTPGNLVDSPTHRCVESIFQYEYLRELEHGLKGSVRDLGQSDLCKNIEKMVHCHVPLNLL